MYTVDQENIKYQSILYHTVPVFCLSANAWHSTIWKILTSELASLKLSMRQWQASHSRPRSTGAFVQGLTGADMATWIPRLLFSQWFRATPCDTWMSKLRARPQTEPSCKGLAFTLWVGNSGKVHWFTLRQTARDTRNRKLQHVHHCRQR